MRWNGFIGRIGSTMSLLILGGLACGLAAQQPAVLKIGTVGPLAPGGKGNTAEATLKDFVRDESKLTAEVVRQDSWQKLADGLADKSIQVGIFSGSEFVWALDRRATIKPMVLAVQGPRYPVVYVIVAKTDSAKSMTDLKGKAIAIPEGMRYLRLFVEQQAQKAGQPADAFFSKIVTPEFREEAIDEVVDGKLAAAVVDGGALETYKRRNQARFAKIRELVHSEKLIPVIIAYADGSIDDATRQQFQDGMINANKGDRGKHLLGTFKLSSFDVPPADFSDIAKQTLRAFPLPKDGN